MRKIIFSFFLFFSFSLVGQEQLTNLPTFYINTVDNAPIVSKEEYVSGKLTIVSSDETENFADSTEIRGRGNSTWGMPKKPFRIKLYKKASLLNRPAKEKSWVLLANYADKTLMRNAVAFKISQLVGLEFSPSARFVDVVLNGEFLGNYMMSDQIEMATGRVEVEKQKTSDVSEPEITGGYLLELDGFAYTEPVWFRTPKGVAVTVKYPKDDDINNEQYRYISNYTSEFENVLFSSNFTDSEHGYRAYVDSATLINWYIACELTGNSDSFWSTYVYKKRNDPRFYFGPMWDYDIAFNNDYRLGDATEKLMREHAHEPKTWIRRFWEDPWFQNAVNDRWKQLVENGIEQQLLDYINETQALLQQSQAKNYEKWPTLNQTVYREVYTFETYDEGVDYLKSYVSARVAFLNEAFKSSSGEEPEIKDFIPEEDAYYTIRNRKSGNLVDLSDEKIGDAVKLVLWEAIEGKRSQHWRFERDVNDNFHIINRENGLAVKASNSAGVQLVVDTLKATADFVWEIIPTNLENYFGVIGRAYGYCFNNSGGSMTSGTSLIGWTSDINKSDNAKFTFEKVITTGLANKSVNVLSIKYSATNQSIYFVTDNLKSDNADIKIYSLSGSEVMSVNSLNLASSIDVSTLMNGVYVVRLVMDNEVYSAKFIK
ncbi:MAG TPA: T9SS type A sorting domain-containing protein [Bacteroidales bacterium]|nr:T9SS type A sorting domain-containing protein [Bacteroidales bacterium]